jgi:hypothetical protein
MTASDCHARHRRQSHTCAFALHLLRLVEGGDTHVLTAQLVSNPRLFSYLARASHDGFRLPRPTPPAVAHTRQPGAHTSRAADDEHACRATEAPKPLRAATVSPSLFLILVSSAAKTFSKEPVFDSNHKF